uniref:Uncharacterized protein n=1 Tax=Mustela putorius furo TaxID=9669 RepID=M3YLX1_MUSPF
RFSGLSVRGSAPRFPTPPGHAPPLLTPPRPRPLRFPPPFPSAPGSRLQAPTRFVGGGSAQARLAACRARSSGAERAGVIIQGPTRDHKKTWGRVSFCLLFNNSYFPHVNLCIQEIKFATQEYFVDI